MSNKRSRRGRAPANAGPAATGPVIETPPVEPAGQEPPAHPLPPVSAAPAEDAPADDAPIDAAMPAPPAPVPPATTQRALPAATEAPRLEALAPVGERERLLGGVLQDAGELDAAQIERTLEHQRRHGSRFGESAMALGFVTGESVLWALGQQHRVASSSGATTEEMSDELVVLKQPLSKPAEVIRDIRSQLLASVLDPAAQPRRALAVTSVDAGDGRSWFAANLAISLSQTGARTLLIDADLRAPRLAALFGLEAGRAGLSSVLSGQSRLAYSCPVPELRRLYLLEAGPPSARPLELIEGEAFAMLLREVLQKFDQVIVDTPAAVRGADCRVIAARCGAVLTLGRKRQSRMDALHTLVTQLRKADVAFAGVVLNEA